MNQTSTGKDLRYPIGRFEVPEEITAEIRAGWIGDIAEAPRALRKAVQGLSEEQLRTPYRPGGWTVRQVVHHVPDSHLNAYTRFKLTLTENTPTIKPYDQSAWAELADTDVVPVETSLVLLEALHARWVALLTRMQEGDFQREYRHPEHGDLFTLERVVGLYAWHGRHHVAHVAGLRERNGW